MFRFLLLIMPSLASTAIKFIIIFGFLHHGLIRRCLLLAILLSHSLSSADPSTIVGVDFLHHCHILLPSLLVKVQNSKQNTFSNFFYSSSYEYIHVFFILICVQTTKYNGCLCGVLCNYYDISTSFSLTILI